jgi:hypothetical protein
MSRPHPSSIRLCGELRLKEASYRAFARTTGEEGER